MARRPEPPPDSGDLLNLPLEGGRNSEPELEAQDLLPFDGNDIEPPSTQSIEDSPDAEYPAPLGGRLAAGLLDLGAVVAGCAVALAGSWGLGARPDTGDVGAFLLLALCFSYLYEIVPLTFWGRTPGMALAGIVTQGPDDGPLTIRQSFFRWLAAILTVGLLGLPVLLALTGRSLADRLSGTRTLTDRRTY